jgi:hypothetical protein
MDDQQSLNAQRALGFLSDSCGQGTCTLAWIPTHFPNPIAKKRGAAKHLLPFSDGSSLIKESFKFRLGLPGFLLDSS